MKEKVLKVLWWAWMLLPSIIIGGGYTVTWVTRDVEKDSGWLCNVGCLFLTCFCLSYLLCRYCFGYSRIGAAGTAGWALFAMLSVFPILTCCGVTSYDVVLLLESWTGIDADYWAGGAALPFLISMTLVFLPLHSVLYLMTRLKTKAH